MAVKKFKINNIFLRLKRFEIASNDTLLSVLINFEYNLQNEHFTPAFWLHNNLCEFTALTQIQKMILYKKNDFKHSVKISGIQK